MNRLNLVAMLGAVTIVACDSGKDGGAGGESSIATALKLSGDGHLSAAGKTSLNVAATDSNLGSLKYFISSIQICEDLQVTGTAFGNATGCLALFSRDAPAGWPMDSQNLAAQVAAAKASTEGWVDLMDPASRSSVTHSTVLSAGDARSYKWGLITVLPVVKVTATAARAGTTDESRLYTHDGTPGDCSVNGHSYHCVVAPSLAAGPASEATMAGNITGFFRFQAPFTLSADDIAQGSDFALDLAYDPDGLVQGVTYPGASNFPPLMDSAQGPGGSGSSGANTISMGALAMAPIAHSAGSQVIKETYRGTVTSMSDSFDLRVEFFYLSDDPQKAVYSVNVAAIPNRDTQTYIAGAPYAYYLTTAGDGSITLEDYDHTPNYAGFRRGTTVGDTTTVNVNLGTGLVPGSTGIQAVTFRLVTVGSIQ